MHGLEFTPACLSLHIKQQTVGILEIYPESCLWRGQIHVYAARAKQSLPLPASLAAASPAQALQKGQRVKHRAYCSARRQLQSLEMSPCSCFQTQPTHNPPFLESAREFTPNDLKPQVSVPSSPTQSRQGGFVELSGGCWHHTKWMERLQWNKSNLWWLMPLAFS